MSDVADLCLFMIHAHPDDECLSTGGTLARYSAEGIRTVLVIATGGEEGEIVVPELDTAENRANLRSIRDEELACAVKALGISELIRLGYRDSGMDGTAANQHPDSFHQADKTAATARLVELMRRHQPQVVVSYDERGGYGHPDHIACHQVAVAAFHAAADPQQFPETGPAWAPQKLYYTAFPRNAVYRAWQTMRDRGMPTPLDDPDFDISRFTVEDTRVTTMVPIHDFLPHKRAAIACHTSQIRKDGPFLTMPDDIMQDLLGQEHYILVETHVEIPPRIDGRPEDDLFTGLRG